MCIDPDDGRRARRDLTYIDTSCGNGVEIDVVTGFKQLYLAEQVGAHPVQNLVAFDTATKIVGGNRAWGDMASAAKLSNDINPWHHIVGLCHIS